MPRIAKMAPARAMNKKIVPLKKLLRHKLSQDIFAVLAESKTGKATVQQIEEASGLSQNNISNKLKQLKERKIVNFTSTSERIEDKTKTFHHYYIRPSYQERIAAILAAD